MAKLTKEGSALAGSETCSERIMVLYDGIHYDALVSSPMEGAAEEFDTTRFDRASTASVRPTVKDVLPTVWPVIFECYVISNSLAAIHHAPHSKKKQLHN